MVEYCVIKRDKGKFQCVVNATQDVLGCEDSEVGQRILHIMSDFASCTAQFELWLLQGVDIPEAFQWYQTNISPEYRSQTIDNFEGASSRTI